MPAQPAATDPEAEAIFRQLKLGLGHELVTDANVDAVLEVARRHGHVLIEQELHEWRSPCGDPTVDGPKTSAPQPPFNKANARH